MRNRKNGANNRDMLAFPLLLLVGTAKFHTDDGDVSSFFKQEKNAGLNYMQMKVCTHNMIISADMGQVVTYCRGHFQKRLNRTRHRL